MSQTDTEFAGSIPDIYDTYLVPLIFQSYADDLAERIVASGARNVLETAAGSGVVTRALGRRMGSGTTLTVTDLNAPMLERARARQPEGGPAIEWQACDATDLPFGDDTYDAVACQFGAMFFPDRVKGYAEARRVMRSGGSFAFNIWDRIEANHFPDEVTRAVGRLFPDDPPLFMARTPHGHGDPDRILAELDEAGFQKVEIDLVTRQARAASARDVAVAFCQGTPLRHEIEARDPTLLDKATDAAERAVAARWGEGPVEAPIAAYVIEARA